MLIRICLIVALVVGLGALAITEFKLKTRIDEVVQDLTNTRTERDKYKAGEEAAKAEAAKLKTDLEATQAELTSTKTQLTDAAARAKSDVARLNSDKQALQKELAGWAAIGKLAAVKKLVAEHPKLTDERDTLVEENKILNRNLEEANERITVLSGGVLQPPKLPDGLKGSIVQVDPKYEFVVLNIGENQGVKRRGEMLINRNGRLIGKVQIVSVLPDKSVANLMPAWKQDEPFEGDEVLY
jgi:DNA repair exonuclease SbcCD ATPase subunit